LNIRQAFLIPISESFLTARIEAAAGQMVPEQITRTPAWKSHAERGAEEISQHAAFIKQESDEKRKSSFPLRSTTHT